MTTTIRKRRKRTSTPRKRTRKLPQPLVDTAATAIELMEKHWPANVPRAVAWTVSLHRIGLELGRKYAKSRVSRACNDRISRGMAACLNAKEQLSIEEIRILGGLIISARRAELRTRAIEHQVMQMVFDLGLAVLKNDTARLGRDAKESPTPAAALQPTHGSFPVVEPESFIQGIRGRQGKLSDERELAFAAGKGEDLGSVRHLPEPIPAASFARS